MIEGSGVGLNTKIPDDLHFCPLLLLLLHLFQSGSWVKIVSSKIQIQIQTWNWKPAHSVPSLINTPCKGCMCMNLRTMKWNVGRYHPIFDICLCCTSIPNVRGQPPKQTCLHFMIAWPQLVHQPCDWISAMQCFWSIAPLSMFCLWLVMNVQMCNFWGPLDLVLFVMIRSVQKSPSPGVELRVVVCVCLCLSVLVFVFVLYFYFVYFHLYFVYACDWLPAPKCRLTPGCGPLPATECHPSPPQCKPPHQCSLHHYTMQHYKMMHTNFKCIQCTLHFCSSPVLGFSFELAASATTQIHSALLHSNGSTHNSTLQGVSMQWTLPFFIFFMYVVLKVLFLGRGL